MINIIKISDTTARYITGELTKLIFIDWEKHTLRELQDLLTPILNLESKHFNKLIPENTKLHHTVSAKHKMSCLELVKEEGESLNLLRIEDRAIMSFETNYS